jgi:hypothetical protein
MEEAKVWLSAQMDEVVHLCAVAAPSNSPRCKRQQMQALEVKTKDMAMTSRDEQVLLDITEPHLEILKVTGETSHLSNPSKISRGKWVIFRANSKAVFSPVIAIVAR